MINEIAHYHEILYPHTYQNTTKLLIAYLEIFGHFPIVLRYSKKRNDDNEENKMKNKKSLYFSITFCLLLVLLSSYLLIKMAKESKVKEVSVMEVQSHFDKATSLSAKSFVDTITLGAIGDILIHDSVYNDAKTDAGYDFTPMFRDVKSILQKPDLLLANQETILGGTEIGLSSYPLFNSPQEVGDALVDAGIDIVSTANNHSLDKGERGIIASLDYLDKISLPHVGTYRSKQEQETLQILTKNSFKIAYLSYSYGTNGIPIPKGKSYLVNIIDKLAIQEEIQRAKKEADIIVMGIHWGNEYQRYPVTEQKELAKFLVNEGVDIIFGHHPHVLQPMEWIETDNGRKSLVVYSLGNFLSGQNKNDKDIGGMATVDVTKTIDHEGIQIKLSNPDFHSTYVSKVNGTRNYRIIPLQNAGSFGLIDAEKKYQEIQNHLLGGL